MVFKSDEENPITALVREAKRRWQGDFIIEENPIGDSDANGAAEAAVKRMGNRRPSPVLMSTTSRQSRHAAGTFCTAMGCLLDALAVLETVAQWSPLPLSLPD